MTDKTASELMPQPSVGRVVSSALCRAEQMIGAVLTEPERDFSPALRSTQREIRKALELLAPYSHSRS
jgi:hypothetical protein